MADYVVTFFSHFGAIRYKQAMDDAGLNAALMPVPRFLSSSCGTCIRITGAASPLPPPTHPDEIESMVQLHGAGEYTVIFQNS